MKLLVTTNHLWIHCFQMFIRQKHCLLLCYAKLKKEGKAKTREKMKLTTQVPRDFIALLFPKLFELFLGYPIFYIVYFSGICSCNLFCCVWHQMKSCIIHRLMVSIRHQERLFEDIISFTTIIALYPDCTGFMLNWKKWCIVSKRRIVKDFQQRWFHWRYWSACVCWLGQREKVISRGKRW